MPASLRYALSSVICTFLSENMIEPSYSFFSGNEQLAHITRYKGEELQTPADVMQYSSDYEPYYDVRYMKELNDELKLLVLSFPLLRFAL